MTEGDATAGALKETTVFLSHFKDLPDYRQKGKVAYPLEEVLLSRSSCARVRILSRGSGPASAS